MDKWNSVSSGNHTLPVLSAIFCPAVDGGRTLLALSFFERSRVKCKALAATIGDGNAAVVGYNNKLKTKGEEFGWVMQPVRMNMDRIIVTTMLNRGIGKEYLITTDEMLEEDFFNFLMNNYSLPLLREWTSDILSELNNRRYLSLGWQRNYYTATVPQGCSVIPIQINGKDVPVDEHLRAYNMSFLTEDILQEVVSDLLKRKVIRIAERDSQPLTFNGFDDYVNKHGKSLVKNIEKSLDPLHPLDGEFKGFAAKTKRLFPQQAACVNGIVALKKAGSRYGLMVEGMGCGKTLQGAAVVDSYFNQEWLRKHPGKNLKDLYLSDDQPKYRNVLMAPSHLVSKWRDEILSEIPGTSVVILNDFQELTKLRAGGKERKGREWYLISKDTAKLGSMTSPIPSSVGTMVPKAPVCRDCYEDGKENGQTKIYYKRGKGKDAKCENCGGRHFFPYPMTDYGRKKGLVCPKCGNLLIRYSAKYDDLPPEKRGELVLTPADFATSNTENDVCYVCGEHLWGVDCKPVGATKEPARKWHKITHYKNLTKKGKKTVWVLKGHEEDYFQRSRALRVDKKTGESLVTECPRTYGPRRFAPALFIKKYLKGYFDFCILDECHKYENGGTAQAGAAHALMKVSDFTLGLTGTISNGKADSFFYLFYMLDPARMRKFGYGFKDMMSFVQTYGCIETMYETDDDDGPSEKNAASRGRQLGQPKVKPGISPKLVIDFLFDKSVFLDLSDLSSKLPELHEKVVGCKLPKEVGTSYRRVLDELTEASRQKGGGRSVLSTMLQFGLSYPDKPYGVKPFMSPYVEDMVLARPDSYDIYKSGHLLPKEEKLVRIVKDELEEGRNCFIYCAYTASEELNVQHRLKALIEEHCNIRGKVLVMESASPKATEREEYIHKKAAEGVKVFICNMKLVETGLDFCFKHDGQVYNYPTIIFYQLSYELSVMWQASRRHYRLNQKQECRTYYLTYEGTLQQAAMQIMAEKQVAASAVQGKFSADGLAAMAKGVDPRVKLATMMAQGDMGSDIETLENMFDVMSGSSDTEDEYAGYEPPKTFYEIMEGEEASFETDDIRDVTVKKVVVNRIEPVVEEETSDDAATDDAFSIFDMLSDMFGEKAQETTVVKKVTSVSVTKSTEEVKKPSPKKKDKPAKADNGQVSIFDMFDMFVA